MHKSVTTASSLHSGQLLDVADLLSPTYGFSQSRISQEQCQSQRQKRAAKGEKSLYHFLLLFFLSFPSPQRQCLYCLSACYARGSQTGGCRAQLLLPNTCTVHGHPGWCSVGFGWLHWALDLENPFLFPTALPLWLHFCSCSRHL